VAADGSHSQESARSLDVARLVALEVGAVVAQRLVHGRVEGLALQTLAFLAE
jgi:hypothetical protein